VAAKPVDDSNGSADYKANLVQVLVKRCFAQALQAA
jgi:CO/xanthine dehydrogenase FAD-binding subunit